MIDLGERCLLVQFVSLAGSNHDMVAGTPMTEQPWDTNLAGMCVGKAVWIDARAVVLPDVTIRDGAVVDAGVVINRDVPSGDIRAGAKAPLMPSRWPASAPAGHPQGTVC